MLVLFEDVHWIDPTTRELLDLVVERVRRLPALLLITFRPEFVPPWTGHPHVTLLALTRLGRRAGRRLVERLTGGKACRRRSSTRSWPGPTACRCSSRS